MLRWKFLSEYCSTKSIDVKLQCLSKQTIITHTLRTWLCYFIDEFHFISIVVNISIYLSFYAIIIWENHGENVYQLGVVPSCTWRRLLTRTCGLYTLLVVFVSVPEDGVPPHPDEKELCKICMDSAIDCVLLDCGHMVTCTKCGKQMNECPICRQYVVRAVHIFRAWRLSYFYLSVLIPQYQSTS